MITNQEADILSHTSNNGRYVTGEKLVFEMAARGLLHDHGGTGFWPKGTRGFTLSAAGRTALSEWRAVQPLPIKPKRKRQSPAFEGWRAYCEAFGRVPFDYFWKEIWPNRRYYNYGL